MEKAVATVKRLAQKVVRDNLRKAAMIAHDAEKDVSSAELMPPLLAADVRWSAKAKAVRAEKLLRHAAVLAAAHGIHTVVPGQAKVGPVIVTKLTNKKGRGCNPGPSAANNDTHDTIRRVASAV
jgi:hypothetical protein